MRVVQLIQDIVVFRLIPVCSRRLTDPVHSRLPTYPMMFGGASDLPRVCWASNWPRAFWAASSSAVKGNF